MGIRLGRLAKEAVEEAEKMAKADRITTAADIRTGVMA